MYVYTYTYIHIYTHVSYSSESSSSRWKMERLNTPVGSFTFPNNKWRKSYIQMYSRAERRFVPYAYASVYGFVFYNARHIYTVATLIVIRTLISAVYEEESARHRSFGVKNTRLFQKPFVLVKYMSVHTRVCFNSTNARTRCP